MTQVTDLQAVVLGIVQGITEWLPISSTAHLQVVPAFLGWENPPTHYKAVIQLGTLVAALCYFRRDIAAILFGARSERHDTPGGEADRRLLAPVIVGTVPVILFGLLFQKIIEKRLQSLYVEGAGLILFGLLLFAAERQRSPRRGLETVTAVDGLKVGLGQACALIPGASRSGTTITAALFAGLERATAARFSFLLSLPAVFLAGMYELVKYRHEIVAAHQGRPIVIGTLVSFVVGLATIDWLMKYLRNHPTYIFIGYRLLAGAAILALAASGRIH